MPKPYLSDPRTFVLSLRSRESDPRKIANYDAYLKDLEKGRRIGLDEVYANGKVVKMSEYNREMGDWFRMDSPPVKRLVNAVGLEFEGEKEEEGEKTEQDGGVEEGKLEAENYSKG